MPNEALDMNELFKKVDDVLSKVDLSKTTAESAGFAELQPGYYLCEVTGADLGTSKNSGNPQIKLTLKVVENGIAFDDDDNVIVREGSKNRNIFKYYPLKDESTVKRFVSDMLKFENEDGESILPAEAFTTAEVLNESLDVIVGMRIYVQLTISGEGENKNTWTSLLSWNRANDLELVK